MLTALIRFSVHYRGVIVALATLLLAYGLYVLADAGLDIFPEFSPKQVIVQTEAPGLSTEQVEMLVTRPIENALNGIVGLQQLRSESIQGLSIVTADIRRERRCLSHSPVGQRAPGIAERPTA